MRLEGTERLNSSTPGESSRPPDARVYGMGASGRFGSLLVLMILHQVQHPKPIFFIPVLRYPLDYMKTMMRDTTIHGK